MKFQRELQTNICNLFLKVTFTIIIIIIIIIIITVIIIIIITFILGLKNH